MLDRGLFAFCESVRVDPSPHPSDNHPWCHGNGCHHSDREFCIHRELLDFALWISPTETEKHIGLLTVTRFRTAVSLLWPEAKTICIGSTATWTNLSNGDLDFVVFNAPDNLSSLALLETLNVHLKRHRVFQSSTVIPALSNSERHRDPVRLQCRHRREQRERNSEH
jgi:hypothetical protein